MGHLAAGRLLNRSQPLPALPVARLSVRAGDFVYFGSFALTMPAKTPNRVGSEPPAINVPDATAPSRSGPTTTVSPTPTVVRALAARSSLRARPTRYVSVTMPWSFSTRCVETSPIAPRPPPSSATAPGLPDQRERNRHAAPAAVLNGDRM